MNVSSSLYVVVRAFSLWTWLKITWVKVLFLTLNTPGQETGTISVSTLSVFTAQQFTCKHGRCCGHCVHLLLSCFVSYAVITIAIWLWYATIWLRRIAHACFHSTQAKNEMSFFRRSRIVVIPQSNRMHIVISITSVVVKCVVVSSYHSQITHLWYRL